MFLTKYLLLGCAALISKNGQLLLNISPRADGSIPEGQRQTLLCLGEYPKTPQA